MARTVKTETVPVNSQTLVAVRKNSTVTFHGLGCTHRLPRTGTDECFEDGTFTSKEACGADWWSDINAETDGPGYDWQDGELSFAKCVTIPDWEGGKDSKPAPKPRKGSVTNAKGATRVALRAEVREVLYNSLVTALDGMKSDVKNGHQPQEKLDIMTEQVARVARMYEIKK